MDDTQTSPSPDHDRSTNTAESIRALREQADHTLDEHRKRVGEIEARLTAQLEILADELARERLADEQVAADAAEQAAALDEVRKALAEKEAEVEEVLEELANQTLAFEAQIAERDEELEQLLELQDEESGEHESLASELREAREQLEQLRNQESVECERASEELVEAQRRLTELNEQFVALQSEHEAKLAELESAHEASELARRHQEATAVQLSETQQQLEAANQRVEAADLSIQETSQDLEAVNHRIAELSKLEGIDEQLEQTRRKFELALADVHKLKRENSELHEELLSRPEADDQESPELVSLRSERDALAEKLAELENAPEPSTDQDSQQELADLQRRFELAVDDVRQLKAENADLQQRLAAAPSAGVAPASDEPQDWQAQKARLMAALDAEDQGMATETRREELATIEGTISITDQVVAEKDALLAQRDIEIAELKTQLEDRPEGQDLEQLRETIAAEVLADDEAVQAEVSRLQEKQVELEAKLREAELDISVQRATLAREQAALEEKLAQLPAEGADEEDSPDKPRRRWLSALGLKDEENG